jgi:hypothetical protein
MKKNPILIMPILLLWQIGRSQAGWLEPILVDSTYVVSRPQELIARNDSIYVIQYEGKFLRSVDSGQTWLDCCILDNGPVPDNGMHLQHDTLVVFIYRTDSPFFYLMQYFSTDFGQTWQGPRQMPNGSIYSIPTACPDGSNIDLVISDVWNDAWYLFLSTSNDFGINWSIPSSFYYFDTAMFPSLYSFYNRIYILMEVNYQDQLSRSTIQLLFSADNGNSWVLRDSLTDVGYNSEQHLAAASDGKMAFVYNDWWADRPERQSGVYVCFSSDSGSTWTAPSNLSNQRVNYMPRVALSNDTIAVVWHGTFGPDSIASFLLKRSYDFGQTWQATEIIQENAGIGDVALSNGTVHTIFMASINGISGLYYRRWEPVSENIGESPEPKSSLLLSNYPNPFNATTLISYRLDKPGPVNLTIYDILGRKIETLIDSEEEAGYHEIIWDATDDRGHILRSGIYFVNFESNETHQIKKLLLLK